MVDGNTETRLHRVNCEVILRVCQRCQLSINISYCVQNKVYKMSQVLTVNKKKSPNFSNIEKIKLIELIERNKNIVENKKTDNISTKDKEKCWMKITKEFNSNCISVHRDVGSLKNCWDNLKKKNT